ncbi:hypothetical protein NDU88_000968 [Pleurodeles waltl]|uniref:Uncharacterized protein n=1 Tax=Pleurodeles waltl TaxID=8319 RepID=A0AAV7WM73_PLEWA|nr:hypothetical protein NDU88_000968 [Pleurodeles waltl]
MQKPRGTPGLLGEATRPPSASGETADPQTRCVQGQPVTCALHRDFHGPQGCHIRPHHTLHHLEGPEEPATRAPETDCGTREVPETDPSPQTDPGRKRLTPATGHQREALETDPSPETDPGHQRLTFRHHNLTSGTRERPQRLTPGTRERDRVPETDPEHPRQDPHQRMTPGTIPRAQEADPRAPETTSRAPLQDTGLPVRTAAAVVG